MRPVRLLKTAAVVTSFAVAAAAFSGCGSWVNRIKYMFAPEPTLSENSDSLSKVPTGERAQAENAYCYQSLDSDELRELYLTIGEQLGKTYSEEFSVGNTTLSVFDEALLAYEMDHPEVFWLNLSSRYKYVDYGGSLDIELNFELEGDELNAAKETFNQKIEEAVAQAPSDATDYQMEIFVNNYIIDNCEYQSEASMRHNAYGALVNGAAVCDGYSKAFQILCGKLGIDCVGVNGLSPEFNQENDESADNGHMWNCVKIGGEWYHIDVTWNDGDAHIQRYLYFNLTTKEIQKNHLISPLYGENPDAELHNIFVPECSATEYNYLKRECVTLYDLDNDSELLAAFLQAVRNEEPYFDFLISDELDYNETTNAISDSYGYYWIDTVNSYNSGGLQISEDTRFYTYNTVNAVTFDLNYIY